MALNKDGGNTQKHGTGLNQVGFVVDDTDAVRERLEKAGYQEGYRPETHPHRRRVYYLDGNGTEWELVQYFSDNPAERNDYTK